MYTVHPFLFYLKAQKLILLFLLPVGVVPEFLQ